MKKIKEEYYHTTFEKFRKHKRKPQGKRTLRQLIVNEDEARLCDDPPVFKDYGLQVLHEEGCLDELVGVIRSGKEATVYLGKRKGGFVAVKIYADRGSCLFRKKDLYTEGRHLKNKRFRKAVEQRSRIGREVSQALWIEEEYRQLVFLYAQGVSVPQPINQMERVIVMELIGDDGMPAPRLSDLSLGKAEAQLAFDQSVCHLSMMLKANRVHGDYSTYNILWWHQKAIVIDFPQTIAIDANGSFKLFLRRDIESLCKSFQRLGVLASVEDVEKEVLKLSGVDTRNYFD